MSGPTASRTASNWRWPAARPGRLQDLPPGRTSPSARTSSPPPRPAGSHQSSTVEPPRCEDNRPPCPAPGRRGGRRPARPELCPMSQRAMSMAEMADERMRPPGKNPPRNSLPQVLDAPGSWPMSRTAGIARSPPSRLRPLADATLAHARDAFVGIHHDEEGVASSAPNRECFDVRDLHSCSLHDRGWSIFYPTAVVRKKSKNPVFSLSGEQNRVHYCVNRRRGTILDARPGHTDADVALQKEEQDHHGQRPHHRASRDQCSVGSPGRSCRWTGSPARSASHTSGRRPTARGRNSSYRSWSSDPSAMMIDHEFGRAMWRKVPNQFKPSTVPASSSSFGKSRKCCRNMKVLKALNSPGAIKPGNVLTHRSAQPRHKWAQRAHRSASSSCR